MKILLNAGQKYCRILQETVLQYFRPSLSYNLSLRPLSIFERLLRTGFTVQQKFKTSNREAWHGHRMRIDHKSSPFGTPCSVLFDLIFYLQSTIFQLNRDGSSWVESVLSYDKCVLLKDHNAVTPLRLKPTASRSRVKHSTIEPLRSLSMLW